MIKSILDYWEAMIFDVFKKRFLWFFSVVQSSTSASADSTTTAEFVTTADSVTTAVDGSSIEYNYDEPDLSVEEHLRHEDFENKIVDESDLEYTADSENDSDAPIYEPNDYDDLNTTKHHGNSR